MPKKTTSTIITDINGGTLKLSKTRLTEVTGSAVPGILWYLPLETLAKAKSLEWLSIFTKWGTGKVRGAANFEPSINRIGCRSFDDATFKKIMKAARATTKKKAKATKK